MFLEIGGAIVVSPVRCDVLLTLGSVGPTIYDSGPSVSVGNYCSDAIRTYPAYWGASREP